MCRGPSLRQRGCPSAGCADLDGPSQSERNAMKLPRRQYRAANAAALAIVLVILLALSGEGASAQTRPIRIINPFPPGGTGDIIARIMADQIGRARGATMVIEDHPGAGSAIGAELVARAAPDGNTLLIGTSA